MRFLKREWIGELDEVTQGLYLQVYMRHFEDIADDLPDHARALGTLSGGFRLNGAKVAATSLDRKGGRFTVVLRVDTLAGDAFLEIEYRGVDPDSIDPEPFENAEFLLTDEFDVGPDGTFEHRMLFHPDGESSVLFTDLMFRMRQDRKTEEDHEKDNEEDNDQNDDEV